MDLSSEFQTELLTRIVKYSGLNLGWQVKQYLRKQTFGCPKYRMFLIHQLWLNSNSSCPFCKLEPETEEK